jgi:hypothetical protein
LTTRQIGKEKEGHREDAAKNEVCRLRKTHPQKNPINKPHEEELERKKNKKRKGAQKKKGVGGGGGGFGGRGEKLCDNLFV